MKPAKIFLVFSMLFLVSSSAFCKSKKNPFFLYSITQNNELISKENDKYILDRDTFEINIELNMNTGIYINISEFPTIYEQAKEGCDFAKLLSQNGAWMGGAEYNSNPEKNVYLQRNENRWQYWFINGETSRFNSVEQDGDLYCGKRIVENFYDFVFDKSTSVKNSGINKLYVTITHVTHDSKYENFKEHKTESFILEFN